MPANLYRCFKNNLINKYIDMSSDTIKVSILKDTYSPSTITHTVFSDVSSHEVSSSGYFYGGQALSNITITQNIDGSIYIDADDVTWSGVTFPNYRYIVLYDDTYNDSLIGYIDLGTGLTAVSSDIFTVVWSNSPALIIEVA